MRAFSIMLILAWMVLGIVLPAFLLVPAFDHYFLSPLVSFPAFVLWLVGVIGLVGVMQSPTMLARRLLFYAFGWALALVATWFKDVHHWWPVTKAEEVDLIVLPILVMLPFGTGWVLLDQAIRTWKRRQEAPA